MIGILKNLTQSAAAFLSSGSAPPNTPPDQIERLKSVNHLESKKFFACAIATVVLCFFYFISVGLMVVLPPVPEMITGFVTIFTKTTEILAIILGSYVGAQAVVDLKYNSSSSTVLENKTETINENINEVTVIHTNQKEDDYELK
jgi:hypothetical protein